MSYTFRVIFEGVMAFVPDEPFHFVKKGDPKEPSPASVDVFLPDLRRPEIVTPACDMTRFRAPHFPLLKFDPRLVSAGTTRKIDLVCRDFLSSGETGVVFLKREQLRFTMDADNVSRFTYANRLSQEEKVLNEADPEELESLVWVPRMKEIAPKWAKVRQDFLEDQQDYSMPHDLVALVKIKGGRLRTFDFNRNAVGRPQSWRFAAPDDGYSEGEWNRPAGNRLALEFFDVVGPVELELKRIANEVYVEKLVLAPPVGGEGSIVELEITNREPEALFSESEESVLASLPDADFEEFYFKCCEHPGKNYKKMVPHHIGPDFFGPRISPCMPTVLSKT